MAGFPTLPGLLRPSKQDAARTSDVRPSHHASMLPRLGSLKQLFLVLSQTVMRVGLQFTIFN